MNKIYKRMLAITLFVGMLLSAIAQAATINVPTDHTTIQAAITAASTGDEILVAASGGPYVENITFDGSKTITLKTTDGAVIDGNASGSVVSFSGGDSSVLDGFKITNGSASYGGGISFSSSSSPSITNCIISNNSANVDGGGMYLSSSSPLIQNCSIKSNTATYSGGGFYILQSSPTISNSTISNNIGAGITCATGSHSYVVNCLIKNNSYSPNTDAGGGFGCGGGNPIIVNSTITSNLALTYGGGVYLQDSCTAKVFNSIIWGNKNESGGVNSSEIFFRDANSSLDITYSDIQQNSGIYSGAGNINDNPLFVDPANENYHLQSGSPCIDTGTSTGAPNDDIDGHYRPLDGNGDSSALHDMGADEYCGTPLVWYQDIDGDGYSEETTLTQCSRPADHYLSTELVATSGDCDDSDGDISPGATESCDDIDNDCNPGTVDGSGETWFGGACDSFDDLDSCTDDEFQCIDSAQTCSDVGGDVVEVCDGFDNDCDGKIDEGEDTLCDDTLFCNGAEICLGIDGCQAGVAPDCSVLEGQCNEAVCNETDDSCQAQPINEGEDCDDGTDCTTGETCNTGVCGGGAPIANTLNVDIEDIDCLDDPGSGSALQPFCSIQEAIDNACDGDTLIVHDGTYLESINFDGKAIILRSENGPDFTVIDGGDSGSVVSFSSGEGSGSVLDGFTIAYGNGSNGGGISCLSSSPTILNCMIFDNISSGSGGGIYCYDSSPTVTNCVLSGNSASIHGGGINCSQDSSPIITNCTFHDNSAIEGGGIYGSYWSAPIVTNTILWGNIGTVGDDEIALDFRSSIDITYSDIRQNSGIYPGTGNISSHPLFMETALGYYNLKHTSPCIDAANSDSPAALTDILGYERYDVTTVTDTGAGTNAIHYYDMGAYEYRGLDCSGQITLTDAPYTGDTSSGVYYANKYGCANWEETGPEVVHSFQTSETADLSASLSGLSVDADLDVFILSDCNITSCVAYGNFAATYLDAPAGNYYVVVDGYDGDSGGYTLTMNQNVPDCSGASAVPLTIGVPHTGNTGNATNNASQYGCIGWEESGPEIVHTIEVTEAGGDLTAALSGLSLDVDLDVFILSTCEINSCVAHGNYSAIYPNAPTGTYFVIVDGFSGATGDYTLTVSYNELDCSNPAPVPLNLGDTYSGDTGNGSISVSEYGCISWEETGPEIVHTLTLDQTCDFTAALSDISGDADLDVFILSACDVDACEKHGNNSTTYYNAPAGDYYIVVDGFGGTDGGYTLSLNPLNTYYRDADQDTFGDPDSVAYCSIPADGYDYVTNNDDCDDNDPAINPDGVEICDGQDNDCNTTTDEGFDVGLACDGDDGDNCPDGLNICNATNDGVVCDDSVNDPQHTEVCDGADNDCDGSTDEGLGTSTCGLGECNHTIDYCVGGVPQVCDPMEGALAETCDSKDNDCDGSTDEELGTSTCGLGECNHTIDNCSGGLPQVCDPLEGAVPESCDSKDNDCDGSTDEGLGTSTCGLGECDHTIVYCVGGLPQVCDPMEGALAETCDSKDNDCDGETDNGFDVGAVCGSGNCAGGVKQCLPDRSGTNCSTMPGGSQDASSAETCDGNDNDCDGTADEELGTTSCGLGECSHTINNCLGGELQSCDPMEGNATEICNDQLDNDCDGLTDGYDTDCGVCTTEDTQNCYSGPEGTSGVGRCKSGSQACDAEGNWGICSGEVTPVSEFCNDQSDNDCDGFTDGYDTDCGVCTTEDTQSCYSGPEGTSGVGMCKSGSQICDAQGNWGTCADEIIPAEEICDDKDNNCDGDVDEGCADGDVNGDGSITPKDALMTYEYYMGFITLDTSQQSSADVNQDGAITPSDALCIFRKYLGLQSCLDL